MGCVYGLNSIFGAVRSRKNVITDEREPGGFTDEDITAFIDCPELIYEHPFVQ